MNNAQSNGRLRLMQAIQNCEYDYYSSLPQSEEPIHYSARYLRKIRSLHRKIDFSVLLPENKSKTISVDKVRDIRLSAYVTPHEAMRKVYFIPEAQRLRTEAQNALLKLIEEPPEAAYFIMTAPSRSGLLETVISRSAVIPMRELSSDERFSAAFKQLPNHNGADLRVLSLSCRTVGEFNVIV